MVFKIALIGLVLAAILMAPYLPKSGTPSIGMAAGSWQNGTLVLSFTSLDNVSSLTPAYLGYEIHWRGSEYLFKGPEGRYTPEPGVTVSVRYLDGQGDRRITSDDTIMISVLPRSYSTIHGHGLSLRFEGAQIGYVDLP